MTKKEMKERIAREMADTMFCALFHEKDRGDQEMANSLRKRVVGMLDAAKVMGLKPNEVSGRAWEIYQDVYKLREATLQKAGA